MKDNKDERQKYRFVAYLNDENVPKNLVIPVFEKILKYNKNYVPTFYLGLGDDKYDSFRQLDSNVTISFINTIQFQMMMASPLVREGDKPIFGHLSDEKLFVATLDDFQKYLNTTIDNHELKEKLVKYKEYTKKLEKEYGEN